MNDLVARLKEGVTPVLSRETMISLYLENMHAAGRQPPHVEEGFEVNITFDAGKHGDVHIPDGFRVQCTGEEFLYVAAKMRLKGKA